MSQSKRLVYIKCIKTFKSGNEVGSQINEFVHVALSKVHNDKFVIKVHYTEKRHLHMEIKLQHLSKNKNIVQYICHFQCFDEKNG